jgi:hypothetical protein
MRIEKKRRNNTNSTGMKLRTEMDRTRPTSKTTKAPARSHHRRLASQSTLRFSHGSRGDPSRATISSIAVPGRQTGPGSN